MQLYIIAGLYTIGVFTFGRWGSVGGIAETVLMAVYAVMFLKVQLGRVKGEKTFFDEKALYGLLVLVPILLIGTVYYIPKGGWLNILVLAMLDLTHLYWVISVKDNRSFRIECIRNCVFISILIAVNVLLDGAFYIGTL